MKLSPGKLSLVCFAAAELLLAAAPAKAVDPATALSKYGRRVWDASNGLPQNSVRAIQQTPDGYVWLATEEGLVRFDGTQFMTFDSTNTGALGSNMVTALLADRQGNLWIGTYNGLAVRTKGVFRRITKEQGLPGETITALAESGGRVWVGTADAGLASIVGEKVDVPAAAACLRERSIRQMVGSPDGMVWVATTDAGVFGIGTSLTAPIVYAHRNGSLPGTRASAMALDDTGNLWIGTDAGLATVRAGSHAVAIDRRPELHGKNISALLVNSSGIWIGTRHHGLLRLKHEQIERLDRKGGMPDNSILSLFQDQEKNVWAGTNYGGVVQFRDTAFITIGEEDGLASDVALSLFESEGTVWVGTTNGLTSIRGKRLTTWRAADGETRFAILSIVRRSKGGLWLGTGGQGVAFFDGRTIRSVFRSENGLPSDRVLALLEDPDGVLWAATTGGLARIDAGLVTPVRLLRVHNLRRHC